MTAPKTSWPTRPACRTLNRSRLTVWLPELTTCRSMATQVLTAPYDLTIVAPESDIPPDDLEPNDTFATATDLRTIAGTELIPGLTIHENADGSDNMDFYRFETTEVGTSTHYVEIQFAHSIGDLDMGLYDGAENLLTSSTSVTNNERISLEGLTAGVYFLHVYGYDDATAGYDLTIAAPDSGNLHDNLEPNDSFAAATELRTVVGTTTVTGLTIHENADGSDNEDYFRFVTTGAGTPSHYVEIRFAHSLGDLDLRLYDEAENSLSSSTSVTDDERISLDGLAAGTYYARVYGYGSATAPYDLAIVAPDGGTIAPDAYEASEPIRLTQNQTISGLSIHDPNDWGGTGTRQDVITLTTVAASQASHYIGFNNYDGAWAGLDWSLADGQGTVVTRVHRCRGLLSCDAIRARRRYVYLDCRQRCR